MSDKQIEYLYHLDQEWKAVFDEVTPYYVAGNLYVDNFSWEHALNIQGIKNVCSNWSTKTIHFCGREDLKLFSLIYDDAQKLMMQAEQDELEGRS